MMTTEKTHRGNNDNSTGDKGEITTTKTYRLQGRMLTTQKIQGR